jgi:hypothetical protein
MTFDAEFYVPVLKLKEGEKGALRLLSPQVCSHMLPLLEVPVRKPRRKPGAPRTDPPVFTPLPTYLKNKFDGLEEAVEPFPRILLDCREIAPDGPDAAASAFALAAEMATPVTPVTGISRTVDTAAVMSNRKSGVAIRLTRNEFEAGRIPKELPAFVRVNSLKPEETDIIVDLGPVDDMIADGVADYAADFLSAVPDHWNWRTLTVSGSAFPLSMRIVDNSSPRNITRVDRAEWVAWRDRLYAGRGKPNRLPTFSDCAVQHPTGVEGFNAAYMKPSASLRITLPDDDDWLLVKGNSEAPLDREFSRLATRLVYGDLKRFFSGASHCSGCEQMKAAADGLPGFGTATAWRRIGTIHHVTCTVRLIRNLPWP